MRPRFSACFSRGVLAEGESVRRTPAESPARMPPTSVSTLAGSPDDARRPVPETQLRSRPHVRTSGADDLADRLDGAVDDGVALLALTIDERTIILSTLEDPLEGLNELRAVLLNEFEWRQREGLDP